MKVVYQDGDEVRFLREIWKGDDSTRLTNRVERACVLQGLYVF